MVQTDNQRRASDAVAAWLAHHGRNPAWLVTESSADPGTVGKFLAGERWPKLNVQGRIEKALGWPAGTIRQIGNGGTVPDLTVEADPVVPVGAGVDPDLLADLAAASPSAIEAVRAVLNATKGR